MCHLRLYLGNILSSYKREGSFLPGTLGLWREITGEICSGSQGNLTFSSQKPSVGIGLSVSPLLYFQPQDFSAQCMSNVQPSLIFFMSYSPNLTLFLTFFLKTWWVEKQAEEKISVDPVLLHPPLQDQDVLWLKTKKKREHWVKYCLLLSHLFFYG